MESVKYSFIAITPLKYSWWRKKPSLWKYNSLYSSWSQSFHGVRETGRQGKTNEDCHHPHHHVVLQARISLILSRHFSLSFIASGRSSGLHPISSNNCSMYVRAGRPAFPWPYAWVHRSRSLVSSSLLLQQCRACLVRLTWMVFVMGGRWP